MSSDVDVCVVGGGLAGIAAGLAARAEGASVVVLEGSSHAGGKARTSDGLEHGPQSFNGRYDVFWQLLEQLGLTATAERVGPASSTRWLARFGRLHALKPSPLTLFGTRALTAREKLSLVRDATLGGPVAPAATLHDFFAQRFGASFAEGPLAAMVNGIFAGDPRELGVDGCFPGLAQRAVEKQSVVKALLAAGAPSARKGIYRLAGGMGAIGAAARQKLEIELEAPVRELTRDDSGFWVRGGRDLHARAVVVATEAHVAAKLLWPLSPKLGAALGQLTYAPITVVHWEGDDARFGGGFGYLACPSERLFALGTMFHGNRFSTFVSGAVADDATLAAGIAADVRRLTGGSVGRVLRIDRWPNAVFQPTVAALPVRDGLAALAGEAGVLLAGSYLGASAMKDALASGFAAGQQAWELSQRKPQWSRSLS
ncbi:MAG: FAD-dependent oxidoreductase [Myxococcaceae bacterium]|nr:FAD-dependent oxidoreductase [Myxococcaceae bacterium]